MGFIDPQLLHLMVDWKKFLERVWGQSDGWVFVAYAGGGQFKHRAYKYPEQLGILVNDADDLNTWANIYFCPHIFKSNQNRTKDNAQSGWAVWVDKDGPREDLAPKPTICWQTSEGRHQALWLLDKEATPEDLERTSRFLTYRTKSDKGGWHLGKVIRLPGSINYKYAPPQQGILLWDDGPVYKLDKLAPREQTDLDDAIAKASEQHAPNMPRKIPQLTESLLTYGQKIPKEAWEMLQQRPAAGEDWSDGLWKLERLLLEAGLPLEHTFSVVRDSPWNKYRRDKRPEGQLWQEVYKASLEEGPLRDRPEDLPWVTLSELILYSEKPSWLVDGIWMEKNVGWIAGVGKSYKTVLSTDLALSVASGDPFLGKYKIMDPGPVLLVQEEDPLWRVARRVQVMCHKKGIRITSLGETEDNSFIVESGLDSAPLIASVGGGFLFKDERALEYLERGIDRYRPKLVVIDPFFMVAAGIDEYKSSEMVEPLNIIKGWRNLYGCAFAIVHHYRKGAGSSQERLHGSHALYSWSENSLFVSRLQGSCVLIERDIKDALIEEQVSVEFFDLAETYDFRVFEAESAEVIRGPAEIKVVTALRSMRVGEMVDRQTVMDRTGLSGKTVSKLLRKLESAGSISISEEGQGGKMWIQLRPQLWDASTEVIF